MTQQLDITAVILAGGLGTRLRPVISGTPKVLAAVNGRPFLTYILDELAQQGVRHTVLCTGYLGEQIAETFGMAFKSMQLSYSKETEPLGTGGALRHAVPLLGEKPVLVLNGDSFCTVDYSRFLQFHLNNSAAISLAVTRMSDIARYGSVLLAEDGRIKGFQEKSEQAGPGIINAGVYFVNPDVLVGIPCGQFVSLETNVFPYYINNGLYGFMTSGRFIDIGIPADYAVAQTFFGMEKSVGHTLMGS